MTTVVGILTSPSDFPPSLGPKRLQGRLALRPGSQNPGRFESFFGGKHGEVIRKTEENYLFRLKIHETSGFKVI